MGVSPSHKFGQIIGDLLEQVLYGPLKTIADKYGLYLDYKHPRPVRSGKRKVSWTDRQGNCHDLDYVLEKDGSDTVQGRPKAFIETAWRRYTKHSRNKAQEIQGAVCPLAETYRDCNPFLGAVLAGVFTENSLQQLRSHGFAIVYIPYQSIVDAFARANIDASSHEGTPDEEFRAKVDAYAALSKRRRQRIRDYLLTAHSKELDGFLKSLEGMLERKVVKSLIATLHGKTREVASVSEAVAFIRGYDESLAVSGFVRYELHVKYNNGDKIEGEFQDKQRAISFLECL